MEKNAEYQISSSVNEEFIEVVITGVVTDDFFEKVQAEINTVLASINATKLLVDVSALQVPRVFSEAYSRIIVTYPPLLHIKIALVDVPENAEYQKYHETMARNVGLSFKWFTDIDEARVWLRNEIVN